MEEKEMTGFSWSALFFVTGFCSFIFSVAMKLLEGISPRLFTAIGIITISLGLLSWIARLLIRSAGKNNHKLES